MSEHTPTQIQQSKMRYSV